MGTVEKYTDQLYKTSFRADFAECSRFLNMRVQRDLVQHTISVDQAEYIKSIAEEMLPSELVKKKCGSPYVADFI